MTDEQFDEWLIKTIKEEADATIQMIEASDEYRNCEGLSEAAYNNLMKRAKQMIKEGSV